MTREQPHRWRIAPQDQAPTGRGSPPSAASYVKNSGARTAVLTIFRDSTDFVRNSSSPELPRDVIWIDLLNPSKEETTFVEMRTKVRIPSIEMLSEIETSSRLAVDHGVVYLSIPAVAQGDTADAYLSPTGFILTKSVLVTIRFAPLSTFDAIISK